MDRRHESARGPDAMTLSEIAVRRPVLTTMVCVALVVLGVIGYSRLGVNLLPDVDYPGLSVTTVWPDASAGAVEARITRPIEDAVASMAGVKDISSWSDDASSSVVVTFQLGVVPHEAALELRDRITPLRSQFPEGALDPTVKRFDVTGDAVLVVALTGPQPTHQLARIARDVVAANLQRVDGVADVEIRGGVEREVQVLLRAHDLRSLGITMGEVVDRLRMENIDVPGGQVREGNHAIAVRTSGRFRTLESLRDLALMTGADGSIVRLGDVAEVRLGIAEPTSIGRYNGRPTVALHVRKATGRNSVAIADAVKRRLERLELPRGVRTKVVVDRTPFILENAKELVIALIAGGAMAVLVILLFMMDLRSTVISALALPTATIGTFFGMFVLGFSLNLMTLLGLSLAIGLLIDDAIVVRENIVKHMERGATPWASAIEGTREITAAVLATTITLCAVFVPVAFMGGIVGLFFREFGVTVAMATILSAWVALTLDPMLSARWARPRRTESAFEWVKRPLRTALASVAEAYEVVLRWVLRSRKHMAVGVVVPVAMLVFAFALLPLIGTEFLPPQDRNELVAVLTLPQGTNLEETSRLSLEAERALLRDRRITSVFGGTTIAEASSTTLRIRTVERGARRESIGDLMDVVRTIVRRAVPQADVSVNLPPIVPGSPREPIALVLRGENLGELQTAARRIAAIMRTIRGTRDVHAQLPQEQAELQVELRRDRAAQLGVASVDVARAVRDALAGEVAGSYRDGEQDIAIRAKLADGERAEALAALLVPSRHGPVLLEDVARIGRGARPATIARRNRARAITITAGLAGRPLGDVLGELKGRLSRQVLPSGTSVALEGDAENLEDSTTNMALPFLLGLVLIYIVLASQFESLLHPITIMMALPMAAVGALVALFLAGATLSISAIIGIVLLMGLVTKNGILLVDHASARVREGTSSREAVLQAGIARLRPILMTSAAIVFGMLPTALATGSGAEFRSPMAIAVIGGVVSSTALTLVVVPVVFLALERLEGMVRKKASAPVPVARARAEGGAEPGE